MIRDLKYKKDMELLNTMVLYNNLLKEYFNFDLYINKEEFFKNNTPI